MVPLEKCVQPSKFIFKISQKCLDIFGPNFAYVFEDYPVCKLSPKNIKLFLKNLANKLEYSDRWSHFFNSTKFTIDCLKNYIGHSAKVFEFQGI